jgi:hypothetical protein
MTLTRTRHKMPDYSREPCWHERPVLASAGRYGRIFVH